MRKNIVIGLTVIAVLGLGLAAYFILPKFKADTSTTRTITISGNFTDSITLKPVAGATISAAVNVFLNPMTPWTTTTTDTSGNYTIQVPVPSNKSNSYIDIKAEMAGYPSALFNYYSFMANNSSYTQNFLTSKAPIDVVSSTVLDPGSARCRTQAKDYTWTSSPYYHPGDYVGKPINGVLFCASTANSAVFTTYASDLAKTGTQIQSLVQSTGLPFTPIVYLSGTITWIKIGQNNNFTLAAAYTQPGAQEIVEDVTYLHDLSTITHEFGHLVDWAKGSDVAVGSNKLCATNNQKTLSHCRTSDDQNYSFGSAFETARANTIQGYAAANQYEMFAEMFSTIETPDASGNFGIRQKVQADLAAALTKNGFQDFDGSGIYRSSLNLPTTIAGQNAAEYIYNYVAKYSNLTQSFSSVPLSKWNANNYPVANLPTKITDSTAIFNSSKGDVSTAHGFYYAVANFGNAYECQPTKPFVNVQSNKTADGYFYATTSGLSPNTTYCVMPYSLPWEGQWISFRTHPSGPLAYTLTITREGSVAGGTVTTTSIPAQSNQISCGGNCSAQYPAGTTVTLTAKPSTGYKYDWPGCDDNSLTCAIKMDDDNNIPIVFTPVPTITLTRTQNPTSTTVYPVASVTNPPDGAEYTFKYRSAVINNLVDLANNNIKTLCPTYDPNDSTSLMTNGIAATNPVVVNSNTVSLSGGITMPALGHYYCVQLGLYSPGINPPTDKYYSTPFVYSTDFNLTVKLNTQALSTKSPNYISPTATVSPTYTTATTPNNAVYKFNYSPLTKNTDSCPSSFSSTASVFGTISGNTLVPINSLGAIPVPSGMYGYCVQASVGTYGTAYSNVVIYKTGP